MLGDKIVELRKLNNMTQSDLGNALNISPQAVSKWERNISQPDFDTIKKMSKIFNVSITEFSEDKESIVTNKEELIDAKIRCSKCGNVFDETDLFSVTPEPVCFSCNEESIKEQEEIQNLEKTKNLESKKKAKNLFKGSFIFAGLITLAVDLFFIFCLIGSFSAGEIILTTLVVTILTYCFSNQMFYDNILRDFVDWFKYRSFSLPGIIFGLDFGGILLALLWKVIVPAIMIIFSLCVFIFGCALAYLISPFTFISSVMKNYKGNKKYLKEEVV